MRFSLTAGLAVMLVLGPAAALQGQAQERRSGAVLYGSPDPRRSPEEGHGGLSASGSVFGAYGDYIDDRVPATSVRPYPQLQSSFYGLNGRLLYERLGEQLSMRVNGASTATYYPAVGEFRIRRQFVDISSAYVVSPWRTARLSTMGMAQYSQYGAPFAQLVVLDTQALETPGLETPDGDDLFRARRRGTLRGQVLLEQDWGRRKSFAVHAGLQSTGLEGNEHVNGYDLGGTFNSRVNRYGTFRAGYTRQEVHRDFASYSVHQVNVGGDYGRPLSASRRTFVSFGGGSSAFESRGQVRVFVDADARLRHELGRSWTGTIRYSRGLTFIDEIIDPLLSSGISAELNGVLSRRIDFSGSVSFRRGTVGLSRAASQYDTYGAYTRIRFSLSRSTAAYADYLFYHYGFAETVRLASSLPSQFARQTLRVGVMFMLYP